MDVNNNTTIKCFICFSLQYLADKPKTNPQIYKEDETVIAKVIEMDKEKERFLASLRMLDCYHGDTDIGICILESYLQERQQIKNMLSDQGLKKFSLSYFKSSKCKVDIVCLILF